MWTSVRILIVLIVLEQCSAINKDQLYSFNQGYDQQLPPGFDISSSEIELKTPIVFYGETYTSLFVNNNGLVSFRTEIPAFLNLEFPISYPSIAAFYTNVDTTSAGTVYYRESEDYKDLLKAREVVNSHFIDYIDFVPKSVFLVTWDSVGYYKNKSDKKNTFQIAIISNGTESFVQFLYPEKGIEWLYSDTQVEGLPVANPQAGFNGEDNRFFTMRGSGTQQIRNVEYWSNANEPGVYIFRVGQLDQDNIAQPDHYEDRDVEEEHELHNCQYGKKTCDINARCVDYDTGFCCECQDGYLGNGKTCVKADVPLRANGKLSGEINGVKIDNVVLQCYIVLPEGRTYTALAQVPDTVGYNLQTLNVLGGVIGWLFANQMGNAKNGYTMTSAVFNHTAEIVFPLTNHRVTVVQEYLGHNVYDEISMETYITGTIPEVNGKLDISEYEEQYSVVDFGLIRSGSKRTFRNNRDNSIYEVEITQTINYNPCKHKPKTDEDRLPSTVKVGKNVITYDKNIVRYGMNNKIFPYTDNPCARETCPTHSSCVPYENSYKCICNTGYENYGNYDDKVCVDIDECAAGRHNCDTNAQCINEEGSFSCMCNPGYDGDGYRCKEQSSCQYKVCDPNAQCIESNGRAACFCNDGFTGDGEVCNYYEPGCDVLRNCPQDSFCTFDPYSRRHVCQCYQDFSKDEYGNCVLLQTTESPTTMTATDLPTTTDAPNNPEYEAPMCVADTCICRDGYELINNEISNEQLCHIAFNPTSETDYKAVCNSNNQCPMNALCVDVDGTGRFECQCVQGYTNVDDVCVSVRSCESDLDCDINSECTENLDTYQNECQCKEGFHRDSKYECVPDLCNNAKCVEHASCVYDKDYQVYYCQCDLGFIGEGVEQCYPDGTTCEVMKRCGPNAVCERNQYDDKICVCEEGYTGDGYVCIPESNCKNDPGLCSPYAVCIQRRGEYVCECVRGFIGNGTECNPKPKPEGNFLLLTEGIFVYRVPFIQTPHNFPRPIQTDINQNAIGIDIDCTNGRAYWGDYTGKVIRSSNYDGTEVDNFITNEISSPEGVSIDWVSRNIFWTDSNKLTIEVANLDTRIRTVLFETGKNPRGIAVDPGRGKIFWSDWHRLNPKIEWANMDGTGRDVFISAPQVKLPNSLAMDWNSDSLCYADAGTMKISCVNINTREVTDIAENCGHPFGITVTVEGNFYWTDWKTKKIEYIFANGVRGNFKIGTAGNNLYGIVAVPENCPTLSSVCQYNNGNCPSGHLCLPNGNGGRSCVCGVDSNGKKLC